MFHQGLSLSNTRDIIANSIHLIQGNVITDILDIITANSADTNAIINALLADQNFINAIAAAATNSYTKSEADALFYTQTYLTTALNGKVDVSSLNSYYTKTEIDTNIYTKTQIDTNIYTKTQSDNLINAKQNIINDGDLTIAKTNGLQTLLDGKVDDSQVLTDVPSGALFTDTKTEIYNGNGFYDLSKIHFINGTFALESATNSPYFGSWGITINHGIADISGLQSALDLKRNIGDSYTKTEIDTTFASHYTKTESDNLFYTKTYLNTALSGKVDVSTLSLYYTKTEIDNTFTSYYTKTQVDNTFTNYYSKTYIDTNFYNKTYIDALNTSGVQIKYNSNYVDLEKIEFQDSTISLGTNTNEYKIVSTPQMSNVQGLTAALNAKRNVSDSYTKTEIQSYLNTKADSGDLLQVNTGGTTYQQITHILFSNANTSVTSGVATVNVLPTISEVIGLNTALNAKVDDTQVLTNVPANATFSFPEVKYNTAYIEASKFEFMNHTVSTNSNPTRVEITATPNLSDIADITVATANISFGKPLTNVLANDPGFGTEAPFQYIMTSTLAHQISAKFDSTNNDQNYISWRLRDTSGSLQETLKIRADKSLECFGNINTNSISIQGTDLQTTLNNKVNTADAYPEIWFSSGNTYQRLDKLYFSNFEYPLQLGINSNAEGYGAWHLKATPHYTDVVGLGMVTTDSSNNFTLGHGLTINSRGDAGTGEKSVLYFKDQASNDSHYIATRFSTTSNVNNVLKFYLRDTSGTIQLCMQMRADKGMNIYGTLYVIQLTVTNNATIYQHLYVSGNASANSFITTSDETVKDDVKDVDLSPIFDSCNVKSYNRTDKPELGRRVGFIAQDIQKACNDNNLPNTFNNEIKQDDGTTLLGLDYSRLVTALWSKVKQLEQRIAVLENN
jgi:hypothetical protein